MRPHVSSSCQVRVHNFLRFACAFTMLAPVALATQEPRAWSSSDSLVFHTFSIAAIDPRTGESGVAVTTRVPCVGNGVPWVRAGVGAVATQANTRTEYGNQLLDALAAGESPSSALSKLLAGDSAAESRQVGVISSDGSSAQHTGNQTRAWAGHRSGTNYVTQGNLLVGAGVLAAVAQTFERSEGKAMHLADRLIEALAAGHAEGGDARKGRLQSAAVIVADPRPGRSRRPDRVTVNVSVCEHPEPVAELRRVYNSISQTLGYRTLQSFSGGDIWQLKIMLHAVGRFRPDQRELARGQDALVYTAEAVAAVDAFRVAEGLSGPESGSPSGLVDEELIQRLWAALERAGRADQVRQLLLESTAVRR